MMFLINLSHLGIRFKIVNTHKDCLSPFFSLGLENDHVSFSPGLYNQGLSGEHVTGEPATDPLKLGDLIFVVGLEQSSR